MRSMHDFIELIKVNRPNSDVDIVLSGLYIQVLADMKVYNKNLNSWTLQKNNSKIYGSEPIGVNFAIVTL